MRLERCRLCELRIKSRYRVIKMDEKMRLHESVHKDPAGGHFGVHKM